MAAGRQGGRYFLEKTRVQWLDLCKFFGILYMVWGHAGVSKELDIYLLFYLRIFVSSRAVHISEVFVEPDKIFADPLYRIWLWPEYALESGL